MPNKKQIRRILKSTTISFVVLAAILGTLGFIPFLPVQIARATATVATQPDDFNYYDIYRGGDDIFAMSVFSLSSDTGTDTLDSVKLTIQGTVTASEIASVKVYQENSDDITFDSVDDTLLGTQTTVAVGSEITIDTSATAIPTTAARYYLVIVLEAEGSLTSGHNLRIDIPADSLTVSGSTLTVTAFNGYCSAFIDLGSGVGGGDQLFVENAEFVDATTVDIFFSKEVNETTAETVTNYTFGGGTISGNPTSAVLQPSNMRVRLTKTAVTFVGTGRDTVTVSANVTDLAGNANQTTAAIYIVGGGGGGGGGGMIVISEVQTAGGTTEDEFVELHNTTGAAIDLSSPQVYLHIVNSSGIDGNKTLTLTNSSIAGNGFFLIAAASTYDSSATADATYDASSGNTLADNSAVYISYSSAAYSSIIDKVGWGQAAEYEGGMAVNTSYSVADWGPSANGSIERKANYSSTAATMASGGADETYGNSYDTDYNYEDFVIQTTSNPQATTSTPSAETPGGAGHGTENTPPMIMHMNVARAIKSDATLDIAARMSDESGVLAASNAALYYCDSGSGTNCDAVSEFTAVTGSAVGSGYFKFQIPASVRNGANVTTNDIRYVLKATDPVDSNKVKYMSQNPQADMTCDYGPNYTCDTANIFANPIVIDVITSVEAASYSCNQTISGTITESSTGLSGVYLFLEGTAISDTSRGTGYFVFSNVCPGSYQIIGAKSGYMDAMYWASAGETGISMSISQGHTGGGGDYTRPMVMYSMPGDMMQGHPTSQNIYVIFNKEMDSSTVTGGVNTSSNIYLTDGSNVAAGTVTYSSANTGRPSGAPTDDYLLIYDPASNLNPGVNYTLVINSSVAASNGQTIEGNRSGGGYSLSFTSAYDVGSGGTQASTYDYGHGANYPPYVMAMSPGSGSYDVSLNTKINITFNEPMSSSSINTSNITIYTVSNPFTATESETAFEDFSVALDSTGEIAIITPTNNLTASTHYRVKVLGNCTSAKGTVMSQSSGAEMFRSDFDTGSTTDGTAPTISGTYPNDGETGVPANLPSVNIGFSESMNPATITSNTVKLKQGNTAISSIVEYNVGERAAYIMPSVALNPGGTYTIEVIAGSSGVADVASNYLADQSATLAGTQNYNATFTVTTTQDTDYPTIQYANCDDFSCAVTFSEPMNSARVGEAAYTAGYSVLDRNNYQIKEGPAGTTSWGGITAEDLSSVNIEYDQMNNTIRLTGLALTSANDFELTVSNAGDRFINSNNESAHQIGGSAGASTFIGPISNSYETGGMMGPGGPGPMMGPPVMGTGTGGSTAMGGAMGYDFGGNWEKPTDVMPMNMMAGATTKYFVSLPITTAIPSGGTIVLTFPSGFNVVSADAVSTTYSMANKDLNGPASGAPTIASVSANVTARTVTVTTSGDIAANDYVMFDLKGIKNSTVARGFDTNGYTVDIKTKNDSGKLLESLSSFPFFINEAGDYTLTGTITATGATGGTTTVYLGSPMTGPMETTVTFSAGSASYEFTGLSEGDYYLHTEPSISLTGGDYIGYMTPDPIFVNSGNCPSNACTKNFSFTKQDTSTAYQVTVNIVGNFSSMSGTDLDIDVFAGGPNGHAIKTVTVLAQNYPAGSPYQTQIYVPSTGEWWIGMGPAMPHGTMMMGPPPTPSWMPPGDQRIEIASGTAYGNVGTITFTVSVASNQIIGYVVDSSGNAIANVEVEAHRTQGGFGMPSHGKTDNSGKFTLKVTTGIYEVNAWMPGLPWSPGRTVDVRTDTDSGATDGNSTADIYKDRGTTLVIDLTSGYNSANPETELLIRLNKSSTTISGKLLDDSGNPVAYAPVWAYNRTTGMQMPSGTDSSGNYTIYVSDGNWYVEAFIPGIGDVSYANNPVSVSGSNRSDINIRPSVTNLATITGTISNVTNGSVWVDGTDPSGYNYHNSTNIGSSGGYRLRVPGGTNYVLKAWTPTYGELAPISLGTVTAGTTYTGGTDYTEFSIATMKVLTSNFTGYSNLASNTEAFLDLFQPGTAGAQMTKGNHKRIADLSSTASTTLQIPADSGYEMHLQIPGIGGLSPTCQNDGTNATCSAGSGGAPDTWTVNENASVTFDLTALGDLYTFTLNLQDYTSGALSDAFVWLGSRTFHAGQPTDSNGQATIKVPAGTYKLGGDKPGYTSPSLTSIIAGTGTNLATVCSNSDPETNKACTVTVTLTANPYTLSGYIYADANSNGSYDSGEGIANTWVWADKVTSATDFSFAGGWTGDETDSNGAYELSISDGYWLVRAVSDAYQETFYKVGGARTAIQINGVSQTGANIAMTTRSGYTATKPKSAPVTPASGGTINDIANTGVKLIIPASALGTDTSSGSVNIKDTYTVPKTDGIIPLGGKGKEISATNSAGQAITTLTGSATIEITYNESDLPTGITEDELKMVYFDAASNEWVEVTAAQDITNDKFSGATTHFTTYAVAYTADNTGPTQPGTPTATSTTSSSVTLSWTASIDNETSVDGYEITRSTDGTNFSTIGSTDPWSTGSYVSSVLNSTTSYTDSTVSASTTYYYQVIAYDTAGNHSASSASLTVTTLAGGGGGGSVPVNNPPSISNIEAVVAANQATITWTTNENSISWIIYGESTDYGEEVKTAEYITSHSLVLSGLTPSTTYHYQVKAEDEAGKAGSYTDKTFTTLATATAPPLPTPPTPPTPLPELPEIPKLEKPVSEMTIAELQAKIAEFMAVIQKLQELLVQIAQAPEITGIPVTYEFKTTLEYGDISDDVKYLQLFLNSDPETRLAESGVGSPGNETNYFGSLTKKAVIKFQEKYASDILAPWELTEGNGFVGKTTKIKINKILGR